MILHENNYKLLENRRIIELCKLNQKILHKKFMQKNTVKKNVCLNYNILYLTKLRTVKWENCVTIHINERKCSSVNTKKN